MTNEISGIFQFIGRKGWENVKSEMDYDHNNQILEDECKHYLMEHCGDIDGLKNLQDVSAQEDLICKFWRAINTNRIGNSVVKIDDNEERNLQKRVELEGALFDYQQNQYSATPTGIGKYATEWHGRVSDYLNDLISARPNEIMSFNSTEDLVSFLNEHLETAKNNATAGCVAKEQMETTLKNLKTQYPGLKLEALPDDLQQQIQSAVDALDFTGLSDNEKVSTIRTTIIELVNSYTNNDTDYTDLNKLKLEHQLRTQIKNDIEENAAVNKIFDMNDYDDDDIKAVTEQFITDYMNENITAENWKDFFGTNVENLLATFQESTTYKQLESPAIVEQVLTGTNPATQEVIPAKTDDDKDNPGLVSTYIQEYINDNMLDIDKDIVNYLLGLDEKERSEAFNSIIADVVEKWKNGEFDSKTDLAEAIAQKIKKAIKNGDMEADITKATGKLIQKAALDAMNEKISYGENQDSYQVNLGDKNGAVELPHSITAGNTTYGSEKISYESSDPNILEISGQSFIVKGNGVENGVYNVTITMKVGDVSVQKVVKIQVNSRPLPGYAADNDKDGRLTDYIHDNTHTSFNCWWNSDWQAAKDNAINGLRNWVNSLKDDLVAKGCNKAKLTAAANTVIAYYENIINGINSYCNDKDTHETKYVGNESYYHFAWDKQKHMDDHGWDWCANENPNTTSGVSVLTSYNNSDTSVILFDLSKVYEKFSAAYNA